MKLNCLKKLMKLKSLKIMLSICKYIFVYRFENLKEQLMVSAQFQEGFYISKDIYRQSLRS